MPTSLSGLADAGGLTMAQFTLALSQAQGHDPAMPAKAVVAAAGYVGNTPSPTNSAVLS